MRRGGRHLTVLAAVSLVLAMILTLAATGCGESAESAEEPLTITETDNGGNFAVKTGETVVVVLPGNPTTGYSWMASLDEQSASVLNQQGEPVYAAGTTDETVVGGGGTYTFTFTAATKGQADLRLIYARSWEDEAPEQTFQVSVTVQ